MRVTMLGGEPSDAALTAAEIAYAEDEARKARLLDLGKTGLKLLSDTAVGIYGKKSGTPAPDPTFFEKNKQIIIAGAVIVGVVLVAGGLKMKRKRTNPRRRRRASRRRR